MDGSDGNEGVGSNADRNRTRDGDLLQIMYMMSDTSCRPEVEAPSKTDIQRELAAAMSTREILINKQRKRR